MHPDESLASLISARLEGDSAGAVASGVTVQTIVRDGIDNDGH